MNRFGFHYDPRSCGYRFAFRFPIPLNRYKRSNQVSNPTPSAIIAIYVSKEDWLMFEYADPMKGISEPVKITTGEAFVHLAQTLPPAQWLALREALDTQGVWVRVKALIEIKG